MKMGRKNKMNCWFPQKNARTKKSTFFMDKVKPKKSSFSMVWVKSEKIIISQEKNAQKPVFAVKNAQKCHEKSVECKIVPQHYPIERVKNVSFPMRPQRKPVNFPNAWINQHFSNGIRWHENSAFFCFSSHGHDCGSFPDQPIMFPTISCYIFN